MNKAGISQAISQIDVLYIQEAIEADKAMSKVNKKRVHQFHKVYKMASCICMTFLAIFLVTLTVFAASESFRETVISLLYPIYSSDEIKELDNGHKPGYFDAQYTLLSFLDRFNAEKMEFGVLAENNNGYTYSLLSDSPDRILAIVPCNISNYKILVTMKRLAYKDTVGIWQVVSYQMITSEEASELLKRVPEYVPAKQKVNANPADSIIRAEGTCAVIYNASDKKHIVTLTEEESRQIEEMFEKYTETTKLTASGLQDMVIKYENVMYVFSADGNVIVRGKAGVPRTQIVLLPEDLEILLNIFNNYDIKTRQ